MNRSHYLLVSLLVLLACSVVGAGAFAATEPGSRDLQDYPSRDLGQDLGRGEIPDTPTKSQGTASIKDEAKDKSVDLGAAGAPTDSQLPKRRGFQRHRGENGIPLGQTEGDRPIGNVTICHKP